MDRIFPWIASSVERCLSSYLGTATESVVEVSDDGHSLRFTLGGVPTPTLAIVADWAHDRAILMDQENQIDAVFAGESFDESHSRSFPPQPMKDNPKKHMIQLLDFEIVLPYPASEPEIQLYVNRFCINWERGIIKFTPSKKLKKNQTIKSLIRTTNLTRQIRRAPMARKPASSPNTVLSKSTASQLDPSTQISLHQKSPVTGVESQQLFSQIPSVHHSRKVGTNYDTGRPSLNRSTELLQVLAPTASVPKSDWITRSEARVANTTPDRAAKLPALNTTESSRLQRFDSTSAAVLQKQADTISDTLLSHHQSGYSRDQSTTEVVIEITETGRRAAIEQHEELPSSQKAREVQKENQVVSKKRQRSSPDSVGQESPDSSQNNGTPREPSGGSASRKRQRTVPEEESQADLAGSYKDDGNNTRASPKVQNPSSALGPLQDEITSKPEDPWAGLRTIPTRDVTIPKDQAQLLDGNFCWIPPNPGNTDPRGHVPPTLLKQWNNIARRRHELVEQARRTPEASQPLPTQESIMLTCETKSESDDEALGSWPPTPEPRQPQSRLPADSSPVWPPSRSRKTPTPSDDANNARLSQLVQNGGAEIATGSHIPSQPELVQIKSPEASAHQKPSPCKTPPPKETPQNLEHSAQPSVMDLVHCESQPSGAKMNDSGEGLGVQSTDPRVLDHSSPGDQVGSPAQSPKAYIRSGSAETDDESDESEMETAVPLPLGGSPSAQLLSSLAEQEATSPGPSLPGSIFEGHVQVMETPAINNTRLCRDQGDKKQLGVGPHDPKPPSSQADKSSSQSLIFNTYRTPENHSMGSSNEAPHPSPCHSDGPPQVDVLGTQTQLSRLVPVSQDATLPSQPSQSGIVIDSSGPIIRHRGISIPGPEAPEQPSSFPFPSSGGPIISQQNQQSQKSWREVSSGQVPIHSPRVSPLNCRSAEVLDQERSPSRNSTLSLREDVDLNQASSGSPDLNLVARRQGFIQNPEKAAEGQRIYERFCNDYASYSGDFAHFTELCSQLQAVRNSGYLQRSFLWDDFIIMHLEEYARHVEEAASQESKILTYEDYFSSNFSRPRHKKRSLTVHGIEVIATQFVPAVSVNETSNSPSQAFPAAVAGRETMTRSGTTSFVDSASNIHAEAGHSHPPITSVLTPSIMSTSISSSVPSSDETRIKQVSSVLDPAEPLKSQPHPMSSSGSKPVLFSVEEDIQSDLETDNTNTGATQDDVKMADADDSEEEDPHHDTASVELGGDDDDDLNIAALDSAVSDAESEVESNNENWFLSLRHIRPFSPVWSDDPNTPFKIWARADQNVQSERRRRGGAMLPVDGKGVIQRVVRPVASRESGDSLFVEQ